MGSALLPQNPKNAAEVVSDPDKLFPKNILLFLEIAEAEIVQPAIVPLAAKRAPALDTAKVPVEAFVALAYVSLPDQMFPVASTLNQFGVEPTDNCPVKLPLAAEISPLKKAFPDRST